MIYLQNLSNQTIRENILTKHRYSSKSNKKISKLNEFLNPVVATHSKYNLISFNNLVFINEDGYKFTGDFSLIYKVENSVKFSYHENYIDVLKSIIEAYLNNLFNNLKYYNKMCFNSEKIINDLNIFVRKYIEGIKIVDISEISILNSFNISTLSNNLTKDDTFYSELNINDTIVNAYLDSGRFVMESEYISNFNGTSKSNLEKNSCFDKNNYISSSEFAVSDFGKLIKSGYHFKSVSKKDIKTFSDNVFIAGPILVNENKLNNGLYNYKIEGKIIYQITDPKKYLKAIRNYELQDFLNSSFYIFLNNYDNVFGLRKLNGILNHDEYISMFKRYNDEYLVKLNDYGIKVNAICIVTKEKLRNNNIYVKKRSN